VKYDHVAEKSINHQAAVDMLGKILIYSIVESPAGKSYMRVENKVEHTATFYNMYVGKNVDEHASMLMPLASDDLPMCYITQRPFLNGGVEASIVVEGGPDRDEVFSKFNNLLKESPNWHGAEVSCARCTPSDPGTWRITIYSQYMLPNEMMPLFDRVDEDFGKQAEAIVEEIDAFLRSKPSQ
jgi:hypothetical protein